LIDKAMDYKFVIRSVFVTIYLYLYARHMSVNYTD